VNPSKRNAWGLFNLGAAATIWGSTFVVSRYALASVSFLHLVILRFACSTALFMVLFLVQRPRLPHGREWWLYLGSATSGYVLSIPFQFLGTSLTNAHIGSIVTCATPLAMVVLAGLFLHERIRVRDIVLYNAGRFVLMSKVRNGDYLAKSWVAAMRERGLIMWASSYLPLLKWFSPEISRLLYLDNGILVYLPEQWGFIRCFRLFS
jgi:hypothetical protein